MSLLELFCHVDDFWLQFGSHSERDPLATGRNVDGEPICGEPVRS